MLDPQTSAVLRKAVGAAQSGDIAQAQRIAEDAMGAGGDATALHAFLGMLLARTNDFEGAVQHLSTAHQARPDDSVIACNLIAVLIDKGDRSAALTIASMDKARADTSLRLARYRGFLAQSLEQFADAVEAYELVIARDSADFESWNNLGNARSAVGDLEGSVLALKRAMELDPLAPPTRLNLAIAWRSVGRREDAEALLVKTAEDFPEDGRALYELYVQYKKDGQQDAAIDALKGALQRDPQNAQLHLKFAVECGMLHRNGEAISAYKAALAIDPNLQDAYLGLTVQYEHGNREEDFGPLIAQAEAHGLSSGAIAFMRAFEHQRAKRFDEALGCLNEVPDTLERERTSHLRAQVLDRLGRTDEAFAAFQQTNALHQRAETNPLQRAAALRENLRTELRMMDGAWAASWADIDLAVYEADGCRDPVFLIGFPRSGTTLLDTILMGHPDSVVMEEQPALNRTEQHVGGGAALATMNSMQVAEARRFYFDQVAIITSEPLIGDRLLIDKSPLFLSKAPLIQRIFPRAQFILALRHPCDVLLSCYMSNFHLNNAMSNFLRLEDAAEFYDVTFQHWERARSLFSLNVHTITYEKLVEDVEAEVRPLFDRLKLEWRPEVLNHRSTALARGPITTASYSQVAEPIYKRAVNRWEGYRRHLEPVLPILQPWAEKFGYKI